MRCFFTVLLHTTDKIRAKRTSWVNPKAAAASFRYSWW